MKLNRKESYGHISGGSHGAVFEQNGRLFDIDGEEVAAAASPVAVEPAPAARGRPKKQAEESVSPVDSQIAAQGV